MKRTMLKAAMIAFLVGLPLAALALQVDQTKTPPIRALGTQQLGYYRLTINYNDANIGAGQQFGALDKLTYIYAVDCYVTTAFNAVTTNVVTIGTTKANANEIVGSGITAGTIGVYHLTSAAGLGLAVTQTGPITLWAKYTQTGTAATAGSVTCMIAFATNNDL